MRSRALVVFLTKQAKLAGVGMATLFDPVPVHSNRAWPESAPMLDCRHSASTCAAVTTQYAFLGLLSLGPHSVDRCASAKHRTNNNIQCCMSCVWLATLRPGKCLLGVYRQRTGHTASGRRRRCWCLCWSVLVPLSRSFLTERSRRRRSMPKSFRCVLLCF